MRDRNKKLGLLNGRYALKGCLFASDLGYLYHARDTQHSSSTSSGLPVLVHFFPSQAINNADVSTIFKHLKTTISALNHPVLPVTDYGRGSNDSYFVMAAPDSWSIKVLPELPHIPSNLHKTAMVISSELYKGGHISRGLTPQAFLVIPGGLKLLGTALIEQFQAIQPEKNLLPLPTAAHQKARKKRITTLLGLTTLTGALLAGGHNFYVHQSQKEPISLKQLSLPTQAKTTAVLLDNPRLNSLTPTNPSLDYLDAPNPQPLQSNNSKVLIEKKLAVHNTSKSTSQPHIIQPVIAPKLVKTLTQSKTKLNDPKEMKPTTLKKTNNTKEKKIVVASRPKKFQFAKVPVGMELPKGFCDLGSPGSCKPETAKIEVTEQLLPASANIATENMGVKPVNKTVPLLMLPAVTDGKITTPRLTANGLNSEQLKNKAYAALRSGALGEKPGSGCIFYIRLLKRIDPQNPHIHRLARGVTSAYHTQARQKIKQQQKQESKRLLWIAERVIKEFNLTQMNQTHTMLKQRHSE